MEAKLLNLKNAITYVMNYCLICCFIFFIDSINFPLRKVSDSFAATEIICKANHADSVILLTALLENNAD